MSSTKFSTLIALCVLDLPVLNKKAGTHNLTLR